MAAANILITCLLSLAVSVFGVSTGGTSLIIVPFLISSGMPIKSAVATNMFALIFLSASGALRFRKEIKLPRYKNIILLCIATVCGSVIGANLILFINKNILKNTIALMVCVITIFFLLKKDLGIRKREKKTPKIKFLIGVLLVFVLGIYGGFFSGGYVTLLSYILILIFGMDFLQTVYVTKIFNIFSSLAACVFFYFHGLIDFPVGALLAASMSLGGFWGAKLAIVKGSLWIKNLFMLVAVLLAVKLLFF